MDIDLDRWQGEYKLSDDLTKLIIHSKPGTWRQYIDDERKHKEVNPMI